MRALDAHHRIRTAVRTSVCRCAENIKRAGDVKAAFENMADNEYVERANIDILDLGTGKATVSLLMKDGLYYDIISELSGFAVESEEELISLLCDLAAMLIFHKLLGQLFLKLFSLVVLGQKADRFKVDKTGCHFDKFARNVHILGIHRTDILNILVNKDGQLNVVNIQFVFGDQI